MGKNLNIHQNNTQMANKHIKKKAKHNQSLQNCK